MSVPFASAISEHPVTAHATGEVAGQVLEKVGANPDLVVLFVTPPHAGALEDAAGAVRAILEHRCAVCHGCNDAPCQLNLASYEGLTRGANREQVYATRLVATAPTRLFLDAHSSAAVVRGSRRLHFRIVAESSSLLPPSTRYDSGQSNCAGEGSPVLRP